MQADLLMEWQQPLLAALDRNQADLTSQLAGLSESQAQRWEKLVSQLDGQTTQASELECAIARNHQELRSELEKEADALTQLKQQCEQLLREQRRQLESLSASGDQNLEMLTQLALRLESLSAEQRQLSTDSLQQLTQHCDQLLQQFDPLTQLTQHCDQLLREQRQQLNPVVRTLQDQNQQLLSQLTTGLDSLSTSHQQLSTESLTQLKHLCDQMLREQQQQLDPLTRLTQHCELLLQEQQQRFDPLAQVTQHSDALLQEQHQRLDLLLGTVQAHQDLLSRVESQLDGFSSEHKQLSSASVAELKKHYDQLLREQVDPMLSILQDQHKQMLTQLTAQLEGLSTEHRQMSSDSLAQLRQHYDQLREQQQQVNPVLNSLQEQNQEVLSQLEMHLDELDILSTEQKQLSADSRKQLTKQWDQLLREQRQQLDQFGKPQGQNRELLTQLKASLESLCKEQKKLRTDLLTYQPSPVDQGHRPQFDPLLTTLQDQLVGFTKHGAAQVSEKVSTPTTPSETSALSPNRLLSPQSNQSTHPPMPPKLAQGNHELGLLRKTEETHVKTDLLIVRRISSYYLHVMKAA